MKEFVGHWYQLFFIDIFLNIILQNIKPFPNFCKENGMLNLPRIYFYGCNE